MWWMSSFTHGVVDVQCPLWWMSFFTNGVVDVFVVDVFVVDIVQSIPNSKYEENNLIFQSKFFLSPKKRGNLLCKQVKWRGVWYNGRLETPLSSLHSLYLHSGLVYCLRRQSFGKETKWRRFSVPVCIVQLLQAATIASKTQWELNHLTLIWRKPLFIALEKDSAKSPGRNAAQW